MCAIFAPVSHVANVKAPSKKLVVAWVPISKSICNQLIDGQSAPVLAVIGCLGMNGLCYGLCGTKSPRSVLW